MSSPISKFYKIRKIGRGNKRILFLHGLFTSAAFWIKHINQLLDYELIFLDLYYDLLASEQSGLAEIISDINKDPRLVCDYAIAHSFGCIILDGVENINYKFYISMPTKSMLYNRSGFVELLKMLSANYDPKILDYAEKVVREFDPEFRDGMLYLFPTSDGVFTPRNNNSLVLFEGTHFEIHGALNLIKPNLC